jgi:hypothetical protein
VQGGLLGGGQGLLGAGLWQSSSSSSSEDVQSEISVSQSRFCFCPQHFGGLLSEQLSTADESADDREHALLPQKK